MIGRRVAVVASGTIAVDPPARHFRSGPGCRARNEELDELASLPRRQPTLYTVHVKQLKPFWLSYLLQPLI